MLGHERALTCSLLWIVALTALGLQPQQIFEQVEPSVVLIGNDEGFASGVVMSKDGKVLTNYHAVLSALPLTVKAKVLIGGTWTEMAFNDVEVTGVHKEYDLAQLRIKNVRYPFKPLTWPREADPKAGAVCFVIGNPSSGNQALRNTITSGLISSAERVVDGLPYIQISAPINPGNSGGALVDENGYLIGIVTFKPVDTEGIGFAIPTAGVKMTSFVEPKRRTNDAAQAEVQENKGRELYRRAMQTANPDIRKLLLTKAGYFFRMSLIALPTSASPYHNVGLICNSLGDLTTAKAYFEKALEMEPNSSSTLHSLGMVYLNQGRKEEAQDLWLRGAFLEGDGAAPCAMNASISCLEKKDYVRAAYLAQLSLVAEPDYLADQKQSLLRESKAGLSDHVRLLVASKKVPRDFSAAEMRQLLEMDVRQRADEMKATAPQKAQAAASRSAFEKRIAEMLKRPDTIADHWVQKKVPTAVVDAVPAFGGMTVALAFKELSKIGILDPLDASITKYLTTGGSDFLMAAGGSRLVVYLKDLGVLETYDLNTMTRVGAKKLPSSVLITAMVMGLNNPDTALVSYSERADQLSPLFYGLIEPLSGRITPLTGSERTFTIEKPNRFWNTCYRDVVHFTADADLHHVSCWCTSHSPSGFEYATLDLDKATFVNQYMHEDFGSLGMSFDGARVFTTCGKIFSDGVGLKSIDGSALYRVLSGNFVVEVNKTRATIRSVPSLTNILQLELPIGLTPTEWTQGPFSTERRLIASALSQRIVVIDAQQAVVHVHPLKLRAPVVGSGSSVMPNSLFASPGTTWVYDLQLASETQSKIEDAPQGLELASGRLHWKVPADAEKKVYEILVSLKEANSNENFRVVKVVVQ